MRSGLARHWFALGAMLLVLPESAAAQDRLSAARAELDAGRFAEAVRLFDEAASSGSGLDRSALVRLLRDRALARAALRDTANARNDLVALFSLESSADFGAEAPPSFQRLVGEVRTSASPLSLTAEAVPIDGGYEVRAVVTGDSGNLVREVRVLEIRDGSVTPHVGTSVSIQGDDTAYVVQAIGPGGAVLAELGSIDAPRQVGSNAVEGPPGASTDGGDDLLLPILLGVGGGVLVLGAVLAIVLALVIPSDRTQLSIPMEMP